MIEALLPVVYAFSAVVTGILAVLMWRNRSAPGSGALAGVLAAITLWLGAVTAMSQIDTLELQLQYVAIAFAGLCTTIAFLFLFALRYSGYDDVLAGRRAWLLAIHPILFTFAAVTNTGTGIELLAVGGHELVYESVELGAYAEGNVDWGPAFWVHLAYTYVLVLASTVLILKTTLTSNETYRWQSVTVGLAIVIPWAANVVDIVFEGIDGLLALGFGVTGILLVVSVHRFELSNVAPVARPVIMEAVADGVLVLDDRDRVVDSNERARDLLSLDGDVLGDEASGVFPPALDGFLADDPISRERVHHDEKTLEVETTPFGDGDDETGRVFVLRDVTEQHAYRLELEQKTERLDRFASVVSHDLRNPLSVAKGYADLAEDSGDEDAFEQVHHAHERMESLIEDVLLMAREGETDTDPEPVVLGDLAERAWATVDTDDGTLDVPDDQVIHADSDRSVQLFENLFRNAVEHGGPAVTVSVGALESGDGFYVADDGDGIDPAVRDDLFETGVTGGDGTGLGLAIVDRIATAHDWRVDAAASDSGGARFEFRNVDLATDATVDRRAALPDDPLSS